MLSESAIAAGTPQRFTYCAAIDPHIPPEPPDWPGPLTITYPDPESAAEDGLIYLEMDPVIRQEIRDADYRRATGRDLPAPVNGHEPLTRIKISGLLAILDGRTSITVEDWELSAVIWQTSCRVRNVLLDLQRQEQEKRAYGRRKTHAEHEVAAEEAKDERAMDSACGSAGRRVHKHAKTHDDGACTRRCITNAIAAKHRQVVPVDEVIEYLIDKGVIVRVGGADDDKTERFRPGRVQP